MPHRKMTGYFSQVGKVSKLENKMKENLESVAFEVFSMRKT